MSSPQWADLPETRLPALERLALALMADVPMGTLRSYFAGRKIYPARRARIEHVLRSRFAESPGHQSWIYLCNHRGPLAYNVNADRVCALCSIPVVFRNREDMTELDSLNTDRVCALCSVPADRIAE